MKILQLILLSIFLNHCYFAPVSQRYNCETKKNSGEEPLEDMCDFYLPIYAFVYQEDPRQESEIFYLNAIYDCYRELELEKKCQKASPYIPVWPATQ